MSKRFSETDKWKDRWFRGLSPHEKLVFLFLVDNCNLAGFIEIDTSAFTFFTGLSNDEFEEGIDGLEKGVVIKDGWMWLKNFLKHQKNLPLNASNNAHKHIILLISEQKNRFDLSEILNYIGADKGLFSPIGIGIGKGKGKEGGMGGKFEEVWELYPEKVGKKEALRHFKATVKTDKDLADIKTAIENYKQSDRVKKKFIQNGSTFFNDWQGWVDKKIDPLAKWENKK